MHVRHWKGLDDQICFREDSSPLYLSTLSLMIDLPFVWGAAILRFNRYSIFMCLDNGKFCAGALVKYYSEYCLCLDFLVKSLFVCVLIFWWNHCLFVSWFFGEIIVCFCLVFSDICLICLCWPSAYCPAAAPEAQRRRKKRRRRRRRQRRDQEEEEEDVEVRRSSRGPVSRSHVGIHCSLPSEEEPHYYYSELPSSLGQVNHYQLDTSWCGATM